MAVGFSIVSSEDTGPAAASRVEVEQRLGEATSYRIRYPVEAIEGDLPVLSAEGLQGGKDLHVLSEAPDGVASLVKGPIKGQHVHVQDGPVDAYLDVYGADTSIRMDREVRHATHRGSDSSVLMAILNRYFDVVTVGDLSMGQDAHDRVLVQADTDLRFVRRLVRANGLWIKAGSRPEGLQTVDVQKPDLSGSPKAELVINHVDSNLDAVDLYWDVERPTEVVAHQVDLHDKRVFSAGSDPAASLQDGQGLAEVAGTRSVSLVAAVDAAGQLDARASALLEEAGWFIRASCSTTVHRLGTVVQAHDLVRLRGMGSRHDGIYYVSAARHVIDESAHRMEFELTRNRWDTRLT